MTTNQLMMKQLTESDKSWMKQLKSTIHFCTSNTQKIAQVHTNLENRTHSLKMNIKKLSAKAISTKYGNSKTKRRSAFEVLCMLLNQRMSLLLRMERLRRKLCIRICILWWNTKVLELISLTGRLISIWAWLNASQKRSKIILVKSLVGSFNHFLQELNRSSLPLWQERT